MQVSELTIRLIVLLIPGMLCALIIDSLSVHRKWTHFRFVIYSILLGATSYLSYQVVLYIYATVGFIWTKKFNPSTSNFWRSLFDSSVQISPSEVITTCICAIILAFVLTALLQNKFLNRIAGCLHVSDKYGDENLYTFFLNAREVTWVWVRDPDKGLTYEGLVESFSDSDTIRELVLQDVKVYRYEDSEFLYEVPALYLSYPIGSLIIEMAPSGAKENNNEKAEPKVERRAEKGA